MKKIVFALLLTVFFVNANAQDFTGLDKAKEESDKEILNEKDAAQAKTWLNRAELYLKIALDPTGLYVKLDKDAVWKADEALTKAYELDKADPKKPGKLAPKISKLMMVPDLNKISLRQALQLDGQKKFDAQDYKGALRAFKRSAEIGEHPLVNVIDTSAYYNAAIAALNTEDYTLSYDYFKKAADLNYGGSKTYSLMAKAMVHTADSLKVTDFLEDGIKKFPNDNQSLMEVLIDYYSNAGKTDQAVAYLDKVIALNPSNYIYYFVKGTLFDKGGKFDDAVTMYNKTAELKPDYFSAYYNAGVVYYNRSREFYVQANNVPPTSADNQKKYDGFVKQAEENLALSRPYFEKVLVYEKDDNSSLLALREVYFKLKMMDKYNEVKAILESKKK